MTPRKAPTQVVVTPEPWVLNAARLAAKLGCSAQYVRNNLEFDDGTHAEAKDVPAEFGEKPSVWFDVGGGVKVAIFRGVSGGICCFSQHADEAIREARKRWNHPSASGR